MPAPPFTGYRASHLWPYVTLVWIVVALGLIRLRPALACAPLPDYL